MFIGNYTYKLDVKGRISLPAEFKRALSRDSSVLLFKHPTKTGLLGGDAVSIMERAASNSSQAVKILESGGFMYHLIDNNRILIPKAFRDELFSDMEALMFVGRTSYFELLEPADSNKMVYDAGQVALDLLSSS